MSITSSQLEFRLMLPRDLVLAIGHVITQWAHFEAQIDSEIVEFSRIRGCSAAKVKILCNMSIDKRLAVWKDELFLFCKNAENRALVEEIYIGALLAKRDRNAAAHAMWGRESGRIIELSQLYGEPSLVKERDTAIYDMESCAKKIAALNRQHLTLRSRPEIEGLIGQKDLDINKSDRDAISLVLSQCVKRASE